MDILLIVAVVILVLCSAFFASSETGLMSLNRYRLRHLAQQGHPQAQRANQLLKRPDRLLSVLLIGNTVANIVSSALATVVASHYLGEVGMVIVTCILTLIVLVFAEVLPKTVAAIKPEQIAFPASRPLSLLLIILYPLVWGVNGLSNLFLKPFGITQGHHHHADSLTAAELRSVVDEASPQLASRHKYMLLGVLDLESVEISKVMTPRHQIVGIDISLPWPQVYKMLIQSRFSRIPVYEENLDHIVGILHTRNALSLLSEQNLNHTHVRKLLTPPYYVPESTTLQQQLLHFQNTGEQMGIVVDEYGDIQGLATLEDILEEIVGEITDRERGVDTPYYRLKNGAFIVNGSMTLRDINRYCHLKLPTEGPNTLGGLIMEHLQSIPTPKTQLKIGNYTIEILSVEDNAVQTAKILPYEISAPDTQA